MQTDSQNLIPLPTPVSGETRTNRSTPIAILLAGICAWTVCAVYLLPFVNRGWVPHDEGLIAQTAERTANGELPHRDFDDAYTGGLAFLHAASFQVLGTELSSTRWTLYIATLMCVPILFLIASRLCTAPIAALTTILCVVWSVPNYFAALPGWYLLYLAIGSVYCLIRFGETSRSRWIVLAGLLAGLSLLTKINGLYIVAAGLLFILFHDQSRSRQQADSSHSRNVLPVTLLLSVTFVAMVTALIHRHFSPGTVYHYLIPTLAVCGVLIYQEATLARGRFLERAIDVTRDTVKYVLGVVVAPLTFAAIYLSHGELDQLLNGVFVLSQRRLAMTAMPVPPLPFPLPMVALCALPIAFLVLRGVTRSHQQPTEAESSSTPQSNAAWGSIICVVAFAALLAVAQRSFWHHAVWAAVRVLPPLLCVGTAVWFCRTGSSVGSTERNTLFAILTACATLSLVQYPYAANIYFCYFAPTTILLAVGLRSLIRSRSRTGEVSLLVFLTLFAVLSLNRGFRAYHEDIVDAQFVKADLPRAALQLTEDDGKIYKEIISLISSVTEPGDPILAMPDCPEIYFLAQRRNPTRTLYDFFDANTDRTRELIQLLDDQQVRAVVINTSPIFSKPIDRVLQSALVERFPERHLVGPFLVCLNRKDSQQDSDSESLANNE